MKLSKIQRHTAYIIMLAELEVLQSSCLCSIWGATLLKEQDLHLNKQTWRTLPVILPELYKKRLRGKEHDDYWFSTYQERIKALQQCISETY